MTHARIFDVLVDLVEKGSIVGRIFLPLENDEWNLALLQGFQVLRCDPLADDSTNTASAKMMPTLLRSRDNVESFEGEKEHSGRKLVTKQPKLSPH